MVGAELKKIITSKPSSVASENLTDTRNFSSVCGGYTTVERDVLEQSVAVVNLNKWD